VRSFASEVTRVAREVVRTGNLADRRSYQALAERGKISPISVNSMSQQLDWPSAKHRRSFDGHCERRFVEENHGQRERRNSAAQRDINTMVDQLNAFAAEVTRVAREVGSKQAGGQAQVPGVAGTWKDLTDSVNSMAGNLTAK